MFHENAEAGILEFIRISCLFSFEFHMNDPQRFSPNKSYHNVHTLAFMIEMNRVREEVPATLLKRHTHKVMLPVRTCPQITFILYEFK